MEYEVIAVWKDQKNGNILGVDCEFLTHGLFKTATVINMKRHKGDRFYVLNEFNNKVYIDIIATTHGSFIKTAANGIQTDNLDNLPDSLFSSFPELWK